MEPMAVERHRRGSPRRLRERERANGASGKRCDIDAAKRRSRTENWEIRVNQSKPKLKHVPECQRLTGLKNRSRRESNPHLRFRKPPFCPLNYGNSDNSDFRFSTSDCKWRRCAAAGALLVSLLVRRSGKSRFTRDGEHIASGNRDP